MYSQVLAAQVMITKVRARAAQLRREGRSEVGASAIEWAIISAIVVAAALLIGVAINNVVDSNIDKINEGG